MKGIASFSVGWWLLAFFCLQGEAKDLLFRMRAQLAVGSDEAFIVAGVNPEQQVEVFFQSSKGESHSQSLGPSGALGEVAATFNPTSQTFYVLWIGPTKGASINRGPIHAASLDKNGKLISNRRIVEKDVYRLAVSEVNSKIDSTATTLVTWNDQGIHGAEYQNETLGDPFAVSSVTEDETDHATPMSPLAVPEGWLVGITREKKAEPFRFKMDLTLWRLGRGPSTSFKARDVNSLTRAVLLPQRLAYIFRPGVKEKYLLHIDEKCCGSHEVPLAPGVTPWILTASRALDGFETVQAKEESILLQHRNEHGFVLTDETLVEGYQLRPDQVVHSEIATYLLYSDRVRDLPSHIRRFQVLKKMVNCHGAVASPLEAVLNY